MALESPTASASLSTSVESSAPGWKYEVFLSFRSEDGFTSYLYNELQKREIKTFMDIDGTSLDRGEGISQSILEAIQESRFAIVVLSQNYASSSWCLDELTQIMKCMENKETILPVFYHVDPSEVRSQRGVCGAALAAHEERFKDQKERLMKWRDALNNISSIFGWVCGSSEPEGQIVQQIAEFVSSKPIEIKSTEDIETHGTSPRWKYDVFINFRGEDTCKVFLSHLLAELQKKPAHLNTVKNDEPLPKGRNISSYLLNAIEEVRFAIVVLSQDFAYSSWCLEELAKIFECMENQNRILPIFYHVDPSEVQHQSGRFGDAFAVHEERFRDNHEKVRRWRRVLSMVANIPGWTSENYEYEGELIKDVVQAMCSRLVQSTESTEDFEATGDVMDRTSTQPDPAPDPAHSDHELPIMSPPSSAERDPRPKYDVFLSFRGEDTRKGFIAHLYRELQNTRVIKTFKDDVQLEKGTVIASNLLTAIEESRFAIIVLSKNYASSSWCLDELAKIFQCMKDRNTIFPIFYEVEPTDVRHQKTETRFGKAFIKQHETHGQDNEKMKQWSAALEGVAGIAGFPSTKYQTDVELIKDVVKHLLSKVLQAPTGNFETFKATRRAMDDVMEVLKDDQVTVLGVHGVGGVGKTTMVKHVSAQAQKDGIFDHVIMVVVSKSPDLQEIQGTLAGSLGLEEGIMRENRMLIILDDIWESFELSSIGIPSHNELQRCNSKVILTTRKSNVCDSMGCHAQILLNVLSEEDSWKLFMETSGKSFHESTISYDEARKVARECCGLPKAIKAAARSLGDKYIDEWNEAVVTAFGDDCLDKWNETAPPVNFEAEEDAFHSLASDDAKSCFLLCCLFPENYDIPIEDLLKYGIGKGLFQYDTMQEARDRAHSVVKYLKVSRLLLDGRKKGCVRMTDGIRNLAMSIALSKEGDGFLVKAGCELEEWPEAGWLQEITSRNWNETHEAYSTISLMRNKLHKLPEYLVCSKLQILLLQSNAGICDIPETFLQSPNPLRVFDLSFTGVSSLPSSFSFLTNLQTLNLDSCKNLSNISVLGKLNKKLKILSMRELPLKKFPKQIGDLTSLRMLDVTGRYLETIPSKVISRLYRLEELHMKFQFGKWGSKIEDAVDEETNADFDELTGLLDLNILEVYISDAACLPKSVEYMPNWAEFDICISRHVPCVALPQHDGFSRTLTLDTTIRSLPYWFISAVTEKVEKLEYTDCEDLNDIVREYDHGRLLALKCLSVNGNRKNLKEIINTMTRVSNKPVFENLEELHLHRLYSLKELCVGELPPGSLRKLKFLKVQTCRSLVNALLPSTLLQRLQNLEEIICVNLEGMKYVFGSDEGLDPENIFLRKLREMRLSALYELVSICNGPAPRVIFQNLKVLAICECKELKNLFTIDVVECLCQLEDLSIEHCPSLDRVIEASNSLNSKIKLLKLKKLALIDLPVLTRFCTEGGTIETECPSLEYLYVEKCLQFSYFAYHLDNKNQVYFNDKQHFSSLVKRWEEVHNRL
ncbi:putative TIR domain, P-loop containing nucleoside triphosphate hydrolase [Rosa chinensis]|uniref:Putative TIR domain, P-loop containing nucleoside triphosphate hydrolase n=1 Tax=Rosa chinensis TaxID=74649 RepID=A0A2P6QHV6_ROSCH|nr:probable disease resistance protein RPP1 [Rosa chinensis]PRQ33768.1 putative TIR domain, P-loop containing nucleoside triphosphate hydrolase [Rosa chinensis]